MNQGFFSKEELKSSSPMRNVTNTCASCGLYKTARSPKMKAHGEGREEILFWAEAPGKTEDLKGVQLIGEAGQELRNVCDELGIDLDKDCWKINSINCRPMSETGANRAPTQHEIDCCRPRVWREVKQLNPHLIILLGNFAVDSFLQHRWKDDKLGGITKWRGWVIPDRELNAWVVPTYHPSFIIRNKDKAIRTIFKRDIGKAIAFLDHELPPVISEQRQIRLLNEKQAVEEMRSIYRMARKNYTKSHRLLMAFDYETTGLKPHAKGHRIVCCSICVKSHEAIVFKMTEATGKALSRLLVCEEISKTAHNIKFEDTWSYYILYTEVIGWLFDSMLGAHVLDNRKGITGLKFQLYAIFGIEDYSSHIEALLKGKKNNANSFNQIDKIPIKELMLYCGIDSLGQYRLAYKQMKKLGLS